VSDKPTSVNADGQKAGHALFNLDRKG